ncbi:MAG: nitrate reductase cytochrome c-type subunit [Thiogranum sp.]
MKKLLMMTLAGLFLFGTFSTAVPADTESLRGARDMDKLSPMFAKKKQLKQEGGFERSWKTAPPGIPHSIEKDRINLKENTCLKCHSAANYKKEKAPKLGDSHFLTRDGKELDKASKRRYFCNQCHVPQVDAAPLVENTFRGLPQKK